MPAAATEHPNHGGGKLPSQPAPSRPGRGGWRRREAVRRLLSLVTGAVALLDLLSAVRVGFRPHLAWLEEAYPFAIASDQSRLLASFGSFLLLQLAIGLWRGKRLAMTLSSLLLILSALHHALILGERLEALLSAALLLALWLCRRSFLARSDPPSVRQGQRLLIGALAFTLLYGSAGSLWLDQRARMPFDPAGALAQTLDLFFAGQAGNSLLRSQVGREFAGSIRVIGLLTISWALLLLLRPVVQRPRSEIDALRQARKLAAAEARSSLPAIGLGASRPLLFSASGRSVLIYGVIGRGAMALGDPLGTPQEMAAMIGAFRDLCARNDWSPAFYQVRPEGLALYRAAGFQALQIGDEAVVDLERFSLRGGAAGALRTPRNRLLRLGWKVQLRSSPQMPAELEALRPISEAWLARLGRREMGFSVGRFSTEALEAADLALLLDPAGRPMGFLSLHRYQRGAEVGLDLMRCLPDVPAGAMDFLLTETLLSLQAEGVGRFSLGLCALRRVGSCENAPIVEKALGRLARQLERFYSFRGLEAFKAKFQPLWEPRYLIHPGLASLSTTLATLIRLERGGGERPQA